MKCLRCGKTVWPWQGFITIFHFYAVIHVGCLRNDELQYIYEFKLELLKKVQSLGSYATPDSPKVVGMGSVATKGEGGSL